MPIRARTPDEQAAIAHAARASRQLPLDGTLCLRCSGRGTVLSRLVLTGLRECPSCHGVGMIPGGPR